jgi:hypothetical protein
MLRFALHDKGKVVIQRSAATKNLANQTLILKVVKD